MKKIPVTDLSDKELVQLLVLSSTNKNNLYRTNELRKELLRRLEEGADYKRRLEELAHFNQTDQPHN
jgi:hypothetical protein